MGRVGPARGLEAEVLPRADPLGQRPRRGSRSALRAVRRRPISLRSSSPGRCSIAQQDPARAQADYERAVELDGKSWRDWHALIDFWPPKRNPTEALEAARKAAALLPNNVPLQVDLVKALMAKGQYEDAAAVLDAIEALPFEGASEIHGLFARTHLRLGVQALRKADWAGAVERVRDGRRNIRKSWEREGLWIRTTGWRIISRPSPCERIGAEATRPTPRSKPSSDYTLAHAADRGRGRLCRRRWPSAGPGRTAKAAEIMKNAAPPAKEILDILQ